MARPSAGAGPAAPARTSTTPAGWPIGWASPHYVLDYEQRFKATVMQSFADSYVAGETPIPCVVCNQQIKFQRAADDRAASWRPTRSRPATTSSVAAGRRAPSSCRARDAERDQSYFLFATTRAQLESLLFPARRLPQGRGARAGARASSCPLPTSRTARTSASCPQGRYTNVIERLKPGAAEAGDIVHVDGRVLGRHGGIINYTIGQRRGLGVPGPAPLYVVRLDADAKQVVVGPRESLHAHWITLRNVNWLGDEPIPAGGMDVAVRVRSTSPPQPATLFPSADGARVLLRDGEYGVAAGQACVVLRRCRPRGTGAGRRMDRARPEPGRAAWHGDEATDRGRRQSVVRVGGGH